MAEEKQEWTFDEMVRTRPGMFFGDNRGKGVMNLILGLIRDCIFACKTDKFFFSIEISADDNLSLQINSESDTSAIAQQFSDEHYNKEIYFLRTLRAVSDKFELLPVANVLTLHFHLDKTIFADTRVDYLHLTEELLIVALLNRQAEIFIRDNTQKHTSQNYLSFPEGVFYLYEKTKRDVSGAPEFEVFYDGEFKGNKYQIAIGYRTDWYPQPSVTSFANDTHTTYGGTLVDGILDGLIAACKTFVADHQLTTHKIKRKKFYNGLIIVCSVRGENLDFAGSFKEALATKEIRTQAKKITRKLVGDYLNSSREKADKLLWRFDETQLGSKMF